MRHGQSEWNVIGRLQGQTMHPQLTELGREQAAQAASVLAALGFGTTALWSSDLVRALQTAAIIGERLGLAVVEDSALREQALGRFEGALTSALHAEQTPPGLHVGDVRWGDGESTADVHARLGAFFTRELQHAPQDMIVVSHGDTIRVARAWLQGRSHRDLDWDHIGNGAVVSIEVRRP